MSFLSYDSSNYYPLSETSQEWDVLAISFYAFAGARLIDNAAAFACLYVAPTCLAEWSG